MIPMTLNFPNVQIVSDINELINTPFNGEKNAICWKRNLSGDFSEIVNMIVIDDNLKVIEKDELLALKLSNQGNIARDILLSDLEVLTKFGADPVLNIICNYEKDNENSFFSTDVYSYHVDRSSIPIDTYLCTYYGDASDIISNNDVIQKVRIPEIKLELMRKYNISEKDYESFIEEYFFDLHYQAKPNTIPINLGIGNLWKIATDYPNNPVLPCIHRAPREINGLKRLLLIC